MSNYWLDQVKSQKSNKMSDEQIQAYCAKVLEISKTIHENSEKINPDAVKDDVWHMPYENLAQLNQQGFLSANEVANYADIQHVHTDAEYKIDDTSVYTIQSPVLTLNNVPADINFYTHGEERLRIAEDGGFYVNGKLVTTDIEVYEGMKKWLVSVGMMPKVEHLADADDAKYLSDKEDLRYKGI